MNGLTDRQTDSDQTDTASIYISRIAVQRAGDDCAFGTIIHHSVTSLGVFHLVYVVKETYPENLKLIVQVVQKLHNIRYYDLK